MLTLFNDMLAVQLFFHSRALSLVCVCVRSLCQCCQYIVHGMHGRVDMGTRRTRVELIFTCFLVVLSDHRGAAVRCSCAPLRWRAASDRLIPKCMASTKSGVCPKWNSICDIYCFTVSIAMQMEHFTYQPIGFIRALCCHRADFLPRSMLDVFVRSCSCSPFRVICMQTIYNIRNSNNMHAVTLRSHTSTDKI